MHLTEEHKAKLLAGRLKRQLECKNTIENEGKSSACTPTPRQDAEIDSSTLKSLGGRSELQLKQAEDRALRLPLSHRKTYLEAVRGKCSPRTAIKMQCYDCIGHQNVVNAILDCRGFTCPLYAYRPYQ
jgi:hypothetical protein